MLRKAEVNIASAQWHMGELESIIRTVKESGREIINTLPYSYIIAQITIHIIYFVIMRLSALPAVKGIPQK